jgi:Cytochrome c554 and c-prime
MQKSSRNSKRELCDLSLPRPLPRKFPVGIFFLILFALMTPQPVAAQTSARRLPPPDAQKISLSRDDYVGDEACRSCHEKESATYPTTAHHLTSRAADAHSIAGSFDPANNTFQTANPALSFKMSAAENGYYQTAVDQISPDKKVELTERFDLVIGSNRKAQTYLYWKGDELFELPVSWWAKPGQWINSPGYEDGAVRFNRPIVPRCLECHGSFFQSLAPPSNRYNRASLVLGIACEKCHGPGREHVAVYRSSSVPKPAAAKAVVNPATFSRNRQVDSCALCHAGTGEPLAPALSFKPGDTLGKYLRIPEADPVIPVDVHGNQVQLLKRSRCYQSSNMTCSTCHNVHQEQHDVAAFSRSCLSCHQAKQCGKFTEMGEQITRDCIDCHMPVKKSVSLFSDSGDQTLQLPVRDHRIAIFRNLNETVQLP